MTKTKQGGWYTTKDEDGRNNPPEHRRTGARNAREHRRALRLQAEGRNAATPENRRAAARRQPSIGQVSPAGNQTKTAKLSHNGTAKRGSNRRTKR